ARLGAAPPKRVRPASIPPAPPRSDEDVELVLRRFFAERTGYPEEMLESDLELEAVLGIDTVKLASYLARARDAFGLPPDPAFTLREHRTISQVARYFERRIAGGTGRTSAPPPRTSAPPPRSAPALRASVTARSDATSSSPHHEG